jgi:hypothetical protein
VVLLSVSREQGWLPGVLCLALALEYPVLPFRASSALVEKEYTGVLVLTPVFTLSLSLLPALALALLSVSSTTLESSPSVSSSSVRERLFTRYERESTRESTNASARQSKLGLWRTPAYARERDTTLPSTRSV